MNAPAHSPTPRPGMHVSKRLGEAGRRDIAEVLAALQTSESGLSQKAAAERLAESGPNAIAEDKTHGAFRRLLRTTRNPLVVLLVILAAISFGTGDVRGGVVMALMVVLGVALRFVQESRADAASNTSAWGPVMAKPSWQLKKTATRPVPETAHLLPGRAGIGMGRHGNTADVIS